MIAFEVHLNGKQLCTAGVGDLGVLSAHVTWCRRTGEDTRSKKPDDVEEEMDLHVGGLVTATEEYVRWQENLPVQVGDEVHIKIVERDGVDEPPIRRKPDRAKDELRRKAYVREMAKKLGWKLQES